MKLALYTLCCIGIVRAQPGTITTVVGAYPDGDGGPAAKAALLGTAGMAMNRDGGLIFVDYQRLRRITPDGKITAFACSGIRGFSGEGGPALLAQCSTVTGTSGVQIDANGNVFFADRNNNRVRKVAANGIITTVAGTGTAGFAGDGGPATAALLWLPQSLALAPDGTLYIGENGNDRIRRITPDGIISTIAGRGPVNTGPGTIPDSGDGGPALAAQFDEIEGLAVGPDGDLYVVDTGSLRLRRISSDGIIHLVAGAGPPQTFSGDGGSALLARFNIPSGLAFDRQGRLLIAESSSNRIRRIGTDGIITTIAGTGVRGNTGDGGPATAARISANNLIVDRFDNVYFGGGVFIRRIDTAGTISAVAGIPSDAGAGTGNPVYARSVWPQDVTFDPQGRLTFGDLQNVRQVAPDGSISRIAGTDFGSGSVIGQPATQSPFYRPVSVAYDSNSNLYLADLNQQFIGRVGPDGILRLVAGVTQFATIGSYAGDGGPASQARISNPLQMAFDSTGNLYFADSGNHRIRRISATGAIATAVGTGQAGFSGDNGVAINAQLNTPTGVVVDSAGNVYIGDTANHRVRKISAAGIITTIGGNGLTGFAGDGGLAINARIQGPRRMALDAAGNLYVADGTNHVRKITPNGFVSTVAGNGTRGYSGDGGPATDAALNAPMGIALDGNGNLYIADTENNRIRRVQGSAPFVATPFSLVFSYALGSPAATQALRLSSSDGGTRGFQVESTVPWLSVSPASGQVTSLATLTVTARTEGLAKGTFGGLLRIVDTGSGVASLVPVTMTISGTAAQMRLSKVGLTFTAVQGGAAPPPQTLQVLNTGTGSMPWSAAVTTFAGNATWLTVSPASGATTAGAASPFLTMNVNPTGLAAGSYYGQINVTSGAADNSPQSAIVLLSVLPADGTPGPLVDPSGLLLTAAPGANPTAQSIEIANLSTRGISYTATVRLTNGTGWLTAPAAGTFTAGQRQRIDIQPRGLSLSAGVYRATITFTFAPDNVTRTVDIALVLNTGITTLQSSKAPAAAGCAAKQLVSVIRRPGAGYQTAAGWPVPVEAAVVDDCGDALQTGRVTATFSTNDPQLQLFHTGSGIWQGTWASRTTGAAANLTITVAAQSADQTLAGQTQVAIRSNLNPEQPSIASGGILNAASFRGDTPLAPGAYVSVFGGRLARQFEAASTLPLPASLGETVVAIGGKVAPLHFASDGQVNAILPYAIADNTTHQMIVRRGNLPSLPESVVVGSVQPAVFTVDGTGKGQGHIYATTPEGFLVLADNARPVAPGEVVVIYATGLGPVDIPVIDGAPAPSGPFALPKNRITVTVQGKNAPVIFAGLAPGFAGVYQINAQIPADVSPDASTQLIVTAGEQPSPPVTLAVTRIP